MAHRGRQSADDRLAAELAAGKTVRDACGSVGISERTAHRRLADATFRAKVNEARRSIVSAATGRLADGMNEACDVLRELFRHADAAICLRAADKLLAHGLNLRKHAELEDVMQDLERQISELRDKIEKRDPEHVQAQFVANEVLTAD